MPCDRCLKPKPQMDRPVKGAYGYTVLCRDCYRELGAGSRSIDDG